MIETESNILTPEVKKRLEQSLDELQNQLSFAVNLSPAQRKYFTKIGILLEPFIRGTYHIDKEELRAIENDAVVNEFYRNFELWTGLESILQKIKSLMETVEDTSMLAGYNSMMGAFNIYRQALVNNKPIPERNKIIRELEDYLPLGNSPLVNFSFLQSSK